MHKRLLLFALPAAFVIGAVMMLSMRFEKGDMYPEFSSLRADPLGTRALYESLERLEGVVVRRNFTGITDLTIGESTLIFAGLSPDDPQGDTVFASSILRLASQGNRVIIALNREPGGLPSSTDSGRAAKQSGLDFLGLSRVKRIPGDSSNITGADPLSSLKWPGDVCFTADSTWRGLVRENNCLLLCEKHVKKGSIIALNGSYNLSNQGLRENSRSYGSNPLIPFLVGSSRTILFDEWHNGIARANGPADLLRRFGMTGILVFALVWFALFVWTAQGKSAERRKTGEAVADDAGDDDGLRHLLASHIPYAGLLTVCKEEWAKAFPQKRLPVINGPASIENYNELCRKQNLHDLEPGRTNV
jgi:hypothetical protein